MGDFERIPAVFCTRRHNQTGDYVWPACRFDQQSSSQRQSISGKIADLRLVMKAALARRESNPTLNKVVAPELKLHLLVLMQFHENSWETSVRCFWFVALNESYWSSSSPSVPSANVASLAQHLRLGLMTK